LLVLSWFGSFVPAYFNAMETEPLHILTRYSH
jgi:hypothetical protein